MSPLWLTAAAVGLAAFIGGLAGAGWRGFTPEGRALRPLGGWLVLSLAGLVLLLVSLRLAGVPESAVRYGP